MESISRRKFVRRTTAAAAITALSAQRISGANERIHVALIGCGGRGTHDMRVFLRNGAKVIAVCDVDSERMEKARQAADGESVQTHKDFRNVLDMKALDAVIIGTPDHWHALPFVEACKAGKDVYCEKPLAVTVYEGQMMVKAARKHQRVSQIGTQQHSGVHYQEAVQLIHEGAIGDISKVFCWNAYNSNPKGLGQAVFTDPPDELDWDFWLGPAPKTPYFRQRCHGSFRSFWDYSGGVMTDWGAHHLDIVQWALQQESPLAVSVEGGRYLLDDCGETPDTFDALFKYDGCTVHYSLKQNNGFLADFSKNGDRTYRGYGILFYGRKGSLFIDRDRYEIYPERDEAGQEVEFTVRKNAKGEPSLDDNHVQDFLSKIKSRERCHSDVEVCHHATATTHLANIALRSGERVVWDEKNERITHHAALNSWLKREYRSPWELRV